MSQIDTDIYDYVMKCLEALHTEADYQNVADTAGVAKSTVKKIKRREVVNPGVIHVQKLAKFFRELETMPGVGIHEQIKALMAKRQEQAAA